MYAYFLHFQNITYPEIHDLNNNVTHYCNLSKSVWITNILPSAEHGRIILHRSAGTYLLIYLNLPNCCVVLCIFVLFYVLFFVTFPVLFVCICVLNNCHRVVTQLQLDINISKYISYQVTDRHFSAEIGAIISRRDKFTYQTL